MRRLETCLRVAPGPEVDLLLGECGSMDRLSDQDRIPVFLLMAKSGETGR